MNAPVEQESELFGKVTGPGAGGPNITTLSGMQALEGLEGSRLARQATEAGLTGQFGGAATVQEQNRLDALKTQDLQRRLATAGATGELDLGGSQRPVTTLQGQALEQEMQGQALNRALQRAGATGEFREEGAAPDAAVETLESRLRTAGLTGALAPKDAGGASTQTLAGGQAEMDRIGAILAAIDPEMKGRGDQLARALGGQIGISERGRRTAQFERGSKILIRQMVLMPFFQLADDYNDFPLVSDAIEEMITSGELERAPATAKQKVIDTVKKGSRILLDPLNLSGWW